MNTHVGPAQTLKFRAQSLLAYVLDPFNRSPMVYGARRLARPLSYLLHREARHPRHAALDIPLKEYRDLLSGLARRHIRVMGAENVDRGLVGPHLPPVVSGGRPIDPPTLREDGPTEREEESPVVAQGAPNGPNR